VIVLPEIAVNAFVGVKPNVQVEVALACRVPAVKDAALGAASAAMMIDAVVFREKFSFVSIVKPAVFDCVALEVYVAAAGLRMPATVNVAAVVDPSVQLLFKVTVKTSVVEVAELTPHPAPANPDVKVTVGDAGSPVKSFGHSAVIVLPEIAVNAFVGVKPSVQVEVAPVCRDPAVKDAALGAATAAMMIDELFARAVLSCVVLMEKPAVFDCVVLAVYVFAAGLRTPATVRVPAVLAAKVHVLPSVIVTTSVVIDAVAAQPLPANPDVRVTVGVAGTPVKSLGHVAVMVLVPAVIAAACVKLSVHVDVAPV
jgi:hypothetical protein